MRDRHEAIRVAHVDHAHVGERGVARGAQHRGGGAQRSHLGRREAVQRHVCRRAAAFGARRDGHGARHIGEEHRDARVHAAVRPSELIGDIDLDRGIARAVDEAIRKPVEVGTTEAGMITIHTPESDPSTTGASHCVAASAVW